MVELNPTHSIKVTPPQRFLPVVEKLKQGYFLWHQCLELLPKTQKYSIGNRIDKLLIESIEAAVTATFLPKEEKLPWLRLAIRKLDTAKVLLMIVWETKSLDDKKIVGLSEILNDAGKMLGGWNGQLQKYLRENSPRIARGQTGEK
ncbi:MAG: hypothetical protein A3I97_01805 [Candidatus Taylorbacteria bacterium RIFCSPLOWO2_02_FULL_44_35]|nr:MAG: hypothetical protein A3I97_01805 [Candidatus Taylorbacteria bacterium RIFCSPLOWO2_02_FULL_44_35]